MSQDIQVKPPTKEDATPESNENRRPGLLPTGQGVVFRGSVFLVFQSVGFDASMLLRCFEIGTQNPNIMEKTRVWTT